MASLGLQKTKSDINVEIAKAGAQVKALKFQKKTPAEKKQLDQDMQEMLRTKFIGWVVSRCKFFLCDAEHGTARIGKLNVAVRVAHCVAAKVAKSCAKVP